MPTYNQYVELAIKALKSSRYKKAFSILCAENTNELIKTSHVRLIWAECRAVGNAEKVLDKLYAAGIASMEKGKFEEAARYFLLLHRLCSVGKPPNDDLRLYTVMNLANCLEMVGNNHAAFEAIKQIPRRLYSKQAQTHASNLFKYKATEVALMVREFDQAYIFFGSMPFDFEPKRSPSRMQWVMEHMLYRLHLASDSISVFRILARKLFSIGEHDRYARLRLASKVRSLLSEFPGEATQALTAELERFKIPKQTIETLSSCSGYNLHGEEIIDPYTWMENDSAELKAWYQAQNEYTLSRLALYEHPAIHAYIYGFFMYDRPHHRPPSKTKNTYFFATQQPNEPGLSLFTAESLAGEFTIVLDHKELIKSGETLVYYAPSKDASLLAYGVSVNGSDWLTWRMKSLSKNIPDPEDIIVGTRLECPAWNEEGNTLVYVKTEKHSKGRHSVFRHTIGSTNADEQLFLAEENEMLHAFIWGPYLCLHTWYDDNFTRILIRRLDAKNNEFVEILPHHRAQKHVIELIDNTLYIITQFQAPLRKIVAVNLSNMEVTEAVPQNDQKLYSAEVYSHSHFFINYSWSGKSRLVELKEGHMEELSLPEVNSHQTHLHINNLTKIDDSTLQVSFQSYVQPETHCHFDVKTKKASVLFDNVPLPHNPADYITEQLLTKSSDGTVLPIFVTRHKDVAIDGTAPAWLTGYGGFDVSIAPTFSWQSMAWVAAGGVYAEVILRGGGEFDRSWYEAGRFAGRRTTIKDFVTAAEFLISSGYTNSTALGICGASNGALLAGGALLENPELFAAAYLLNGLYDMLRYHEFGLAWEWIPFYGSSKSAEQFQYLRSYSPYHNIRTAKYPATLLVANLSDDRVVPSHTMKFAAALQNAQLGDQPILLRVCENEGHTLATGRGSDSGIDAFLFLAQHTGLRKQFLEKSGATALWNPAE